MRSTESRRAGLGGNAIRCRACSVRAGSLDLAPARLSECAFRGPGCVHRRCCLSEDIDLSAVGSRSEVACDLDRALPRAVMRGHERLEWDPAISEGNRFALHKWRHRRAEELSRTSATRGTHLKDSWLRVSRTSVAGGIASPASISVNVQPVAGLYENGMLVIAVRNCPKFVGRRGKLYMPKVRL